MQLAKLTAQLRHPPYNVVLGACARGYKVDRTYVRTRDGWAVRGVNV